MKTLPDVSFRPHIGPDDPSLQRAAVRTNSSGSFVLVLGEFQGGDQANGHRVIEVDGAERSVRLDDDDAFDLGAIHPPPK